MIENKFFGPGPFPGGPVVRQDDLSSILVRHGDPVVSPWGSGVNAVPAGSVVPLESAAIPRGATRGSVVPSGAPSHLLVGSRNTSTQEIHHPEGSVVPRGSSSATLARPGGSVVPRRDASGIPVVASKFPFVNVGMLTHLLKDYNLDKAKFLID